LVSYWISDDTKATLYAAIVVLESLGHAIGDPAIQQIFAASLGLPPFWQAMPFFVGAVSLNPEEQQVKKLTYAGLLLACDTVFKFHQARSRSRASRRATIRSE
jgi:hypothetical protein